MKNKNFIVYLCLIIFGVLGVYLTFFAGNVNKYDSETKAYRIDPNESYNSDGEVYYHPIYHFKVDGREYECEAMAGSSAYPKEKKNTVYYDSKNPTKCKTEYEKSTSRVVGIICLVVTALILYFCIIKKPSNYGEEIDQSNEVSVGNQYAIDDETSKKLVEGVEKFLLIYKRIVIGIVMIVLLVLILIDTAIVKQTIVSRNYPETTAVYVNRITDGESELFDDCIYTFTDQQGKEHEIVVSISNEEVPEEKIKIKYNKNDPQDYYLEGSTMNKSGLIWYMIKIIAFILLGLLFFNKKLLNKINIFMGSNIK